MMRAKTLVGLTLAISFMLGSSIAGALAPPPPGTAAATLSTFGEIGSADSGYDLMYVNLAGNATVYGHTDLLFSAGTFLGNDFSKQYLVEASTGDLYTADTHTGTISLIGATGMYGSGTSLRWQYASNLLIATDVAPDYMSTAVYTVDPKTAAATLIQTLDGVWITSLAIVYSGDVPGTIYLLADNSTLYSMDSPADSLTPIGSLGLLVGPPAPMDFDDLQELYLYDFGQNDGVFAIDTSTAASQLIEVTDTTIYALANGFAPSDDVFANGFEVTTR